MMKNQVLAIIGLGEASFPVIEKAKEMKIKTVGFGQADSLAKNMVDIFVEKNIFDIDGMCEECINHKVNGVIASSEISTEPTAYLAEKLNLPGNDVTEGFFARNKYLMRKKVSKLTSVKQPAFSLYDENCKVEFPIVVKSVDSCGKQGISLANNQEEFNEAVGEAKKYSSDGSVLLEQYISTGCEYSLECLSYNGEYYVVQITEKNSSGAPHFAETGHHQPAKISSDLKNKMNIVVKDILKILGINCGMSHLELKVSNGEIYFIEVGARGGGSHIADVLTDLSTDCDYYRAAIECSLGIYEHKEIKNKAYSGLYYHIKQNEDKSELFELSKKAKWTYKRTEYADDYPNAVYYLDRVKAGYFIYCSDHKIDMKEVAKEKKFKAERINDYDDAFQMIWNHNKEIGRNLSDEDLTQGINKFIRQGDVIAILDGKHIVGFLMLYCNNYETLSAYICNVYVLDSYRGCGLSKVLMDKAITICEERKFNQITLHVDKDNLTAISLYKKYNFEVIGEKQGIDHVSYEMRKTLRGN